MKYTIKGGNKPPRGRRIAFLFIAGTLGILAGWAAYLALEMAQTSKPVVCDDIVLRQHDNQFVCLIYMEVDNEN
jgi:hypothetical protein